MAARTVKIRHDEETRAYVYRIERDGVVVYVGKGTGRRFHNQHRAMNGDGGSEIIEYCKNETAAFKRERALIQELKPTLNLCAGGNGGRRKRVYTRRSKAEILMDKIGTKAYVARALLNVYRVAPHMIQRVSVPQLIQAAQFGSEF